MTHHVPMILAEAIGLRQVIAAASPAAMALGLKPGMAVTQARALIPYLNIRPSDRTADAGLLADLALHAVRHWTPTACETKPSPPHACPLLVLSGLPAFSGASLETAVQS